MVGKANNSCLLNEARLSACTAKRQTFSNNPPSQGIGSKKDFYRTATRAASFSELYCFQSFFPLSSRGRNNINTRLPSQLPERRLQCAITYFPSHCSSAAQTMHQLCEKQPVLFDCLCPEPTSYRNASSMGAGMCPVLQLKHHRANKAIRGLGTACTGLTPSSACNPLPLTARSGRLLVSHGYTARSKSCSVPHLHPLTENKGRLATYRHSC